MSKEPHFVKGGWYLCVAPDRDEYWPRVLFISYTPDTPHDYDTIHLGYYVNCIAFYTRRTPRTYTARLARPVNWERIPLDFPYDLMLKHLRLTYGINTSDAL